MKKYLIIPILLCLCYTPTFAQKEFRQIKRYIKQGGGDLDKAMTSIKESEKNEELKGEAELYAFGVLTQQKINNMENEKNYLKQKYDTVRFFSSIYTAYLYAQKCDSIELIPDKNNKIKHKFRSRNRLLLKAYYPNVLNAALFFLKKKNYSEADKYLTLLLRMDSVSLFKQDVRKPISTSKSHLAYWSMLCRYNLQNYQTALEYASIAEADTSVLCQTLELKVKVYKELNDLPKYVETLIEGIRKYHKHPFFYPRLIDHYNERSEYTVSLAITDSMLTIDSTNILYRYAKSVVLMHLKQYEQSIAYSKGLIAQDSTYTDAYFNVGLCACNQAAEAEAKLSPNIGSRRYRQEKAQISEYYKKAQPYVEEYRQLAPEAQTKWAPLLYRIYLSLNLGKQFEEIDNLMRNSK